MFRERTRCCRRLLVGLTAAALLLLLPATGLAAERENQSAQLAKAGLLARGAGYGTDAGSTAVRQLQLRLRRHGDRPGPIDGLFGPRTEAAVVRFQRSHGLAMDGMVGPQTKGRLLAQRAEQPPARAPNPTQTGKPERKSPAPDQRAESAPEPQPVRPGAGVGIGSAEPESSSGLPPLLLAIGAALLVASLFLTLRGRRGEAGRGSEAGRRREAIESRLNLGLVCAALLAAGVLGAAAGALFATQAAPDENGNGRATAHSGALLAARSDSAQQAAQASARMPSAATIRAPAPARRADADRPSRANRTRSSVGTASTVRAQVSPSAPAPAAAPTPAAPARAAPAPAPARAAPAPPPAAAPPAPAAPAERPTDDNRTESVTYTVRPGDALWPIARDQLAPSTSDDQVAEKVADLTRLNIEGRIESGDADVIQAGEKLRLR